MNWGPLIDERTSASSSSDIRSCAVTLTSITERPLTTKFISSFILLMFQLVNGISDSGCTAPSEICMLINIGQHDAYYTVCGVLVYKQAAATCRLDSRFLSFKSSYHYTMQKFGFQSIMTTSWHAEIILH